MMRTAFSRNPQVFHGGDDLARAAEQCLAERFDRIKKATMKMAGFMTAGGRHIALERVPTTAIYVWIEVKPPRIPGIEFEHYEPQRSRSSKSNLPANAPRLAAGREAWKVVLPGLGALIALSAWYGRCEAS